jgi:hypothetical protein
MLVSDGEGSQIVRCVGPSPRRPPPRAKSQEGSRQPGRRSLVVRTPAVARGTSAERRFSRASRSDAAAALLPFFDEPADSLVDILAGLFDLFHVQAAPSDAIIRDADNGDSPHRER